MKSKKFHIWNYIVSFRNPSWWGDPARYLCDQSGESTWPGWEDNLFYQRFWSTIGPGVFGMVQNLFKLVELDDRLNQTNICLLPKTDIPTSMTEFRSISLCSVGYKIISKILSSRLKCLLPELISQNQSAIVAKRLITDNILVRKKCFMHSEQTRAANEVCSG